MAPWPSLCGGVAKWSWQFYGEKILWEFFCIMRQILEVMCGAADLAEMLGVSQNRLALLFRHQTIHRTPDAYIDNLRVLAALRLLREKPNYTIAVVAEEAGFSNVRTLQRRIQEAIGMSPVDYRLMLTRDL